MKCPLCQSETKVIDSRPNSAGVIRRRECPECLTRFSTHETIQINSLDNFLQKQMNPDVLKPIFRKAWTEKETEQLIALSLEKIPLNEIAELLERSYMSVSKRLGFLKENGRLGVKKIES